MAAHPGKAMDDVEADASMRGAQELEEGSAVIPLAGDADSDEIVAAPDLDDTSNESWDGRAFVDHPRERGGEG